MYLEAAATFFTSCMMVMWFIGVTELKKVFKTLGYKLNNPGSVHGVNRAVNTNEMAPITSRNQFLN